MPDKPENMNKTDQASNPIGNTVSKMSNELTDQYIEALTNLANNPVQQSPLDAKERMKVVGLGNPIGRLNYLKSKYEAVFMHPEYGLEVFKDGKFHVIDPTIGNMIKQNTNPWELSKELAKDMTVDLTEEAIFAAVTAKGIAKGTATGSAAGGVPGAIAGGIGGALTSGVAAGAVRTSLGRLAGTYEASPQEELWDIGMEGLLALGGETVAIGGKFTVDQIKRAAKAVSRSAIKEPAIMFYGGISGVGQGSMRELVDNTEGVIAATAKAREAAGAKASMQGAISASQDLTINKAKTALLTADEALPGHYRNTMHELMNMADVAKMSTNNKQVAQSALDSLKPFGKIERAGTSYEMQFTEVLTPDELVKARKFFNEYKISGKGKVTFDEQTFTAHFTPSDPMRKQIMGETIRDMRSVVNKSTKARKVKGNLTFTPYSVSEMAELNAKEAIEGGARAISPEAAGIIQTMVNDLDAYSRIGSSRGGIAAKQLQQLEALVNKHSSRAFKSNARDELGEAIGKATAGIRNTVAGEMENAGLGRKWTELQSIYGQYKNVVKEGRASLVQREGAEKYVNRLLKTDNGANRTLTGNSQKLAELIDKYRGDSSGTKLLKDIHTQGAATKFMNWVPKFNLSQLGFGAGSIGTTAVASGTWLNPYTALLATQMSPGLVRKEVQLMNTLGGWNEWLKNVPKNVHKTLIGDPRAFETFVRTQFDQIGKQEQFQQWAQEQIQNVMNPGGENE